jgi:hypothetical protein
VRLLLSLLAHLRTSWLSLEAAVVVMTVEAVVVLVVTEHLLVQAVVERLLNLNLD